MRTNPVLPGTTAPAAAAEASVEAGCTITGPPNSTGELSTPLAQITGTDGDDVICVQDPADGSTVTVINAGAGDDVILGGAGIEWIDAGAGDDVVYARGGHDDVIRGGPGEDAIFGGLGFDTVYATGLEDLIADSQHGGADGYELIVQNPQPPTARPPTAVDDSAFTTAGAAVEVGVLDNDTDPDGDLDAATLLITESPSLGTARVAVTPAGAAVIGYTAGAVDGADVLSYRVCDTQRLCSEAEVRVSVGHGHCTIKGTEASEQLFGTPGDDVICALGGDDTIIAGLGDDIIIAGGGNDIIIAGPGDDTAYGGPGDDILDGGPGDDTLYAGPGDDMVYAGPGDDTVYGGSGADLLRGGGGGDTLAGNAGQDQILGGVGGDTLAGGAGNDTVVGGPGGDRLDGGFGQDNLQGGDGDDFLHGGRHDDYLYGGPGADILDGGPGDDVLDGGPGAADICRTGTPPSHNQTHANCET